MKFVVENSVKQIDAWKAHLLRSSNQDQSRLDALRSLNQESTLLVLDWAMKFLPRKFSESQTDWFGKRGISWHLTVDTRKNKDGENEMATFVHVFEKCNQDSGTVVAILDDVFKQLATIAPEITTIYLRQDNAGCYHSASTLLGIQQVATRNKLQLSRVDFSDPQAGKGSRDRKAATIKSHMKIYLNSGHDIETSEQMVLAMESSGGIPGVRVTLCGPQSSEKPRAIKWDGVSFFLRVWRAYNVGKGRFIPWSEFNTPNTYVCPALNTVAKRTPHTSFNFVKARRLQSPYLILYLQLKVKVKAQWMMTVLTQRMKAACSFVEKRVVLAHFKGYPPFRNILIMGAISMLSNAKLSTTRQCWVTLPSWCKVLLQKFQKYQLLIST